jgi:hypothetical protein
MPLAAASRPDFRGDWQFNPRKGENLGAMTALKQTLSIEQTPQRLVIHDHSSMMGQTVDNKIMLDLTGIAVSNDDAMGTHATTTSRWDGATLITTWKSEGAVAGTATERTEKRYLRDGAMVVESIRGSRPPLVMVYDRK